MISRLFYSLIFLLLFTGLAQAVAEIALSPSGSSDQIKINNALEAVHQSGGGTVYLNPGTYDITGQIKIGSNTVLTGDPNAIIKVDPNAGCWFTRSVGIIGAISEPLNNVEICGFQTDGNCENLPSSYSSSDQDPHDAERLIYLQADSGAFSNNISVHDMKLYDSYSDGVHIAFANDVNCYNNFCSNCQHDAIYYVNVLGGFVSNNEIAGITDDCSRLDNCQNIKVNNNTFFSYSGSNNHGSFEHGENGLQVGNQGVSFGVGSPKPDSTENIEVCYNTFADNGLQAVLLDSAEANNVYVHDNKFVDVTGINTSGISVNGTFPTKEMSEKIFGSIFDILNCQFSTTALIPQTNQIRSIDNWQKKGENTEATLSIDGFRNISEIDGMQYIPGRAQDNVIVDYQTRNDALLGAGQISNISYQENGSNFTVYLTVKTSWYVKSSNNIIVLGKRISVPDISTKSESEVYSASVQTPNQFPKIQAIKAEVTYYNNSYNPHSVVSLTNAWGIVEEDYSYNGSEASHFKLVGDVSTQDNGLSYVNYSKISTWKSSDSQISGFVNELYITGKFNPVLLNVSVQTPYETVKISKINVTEVPDQSGLILNPGLWAFVGTLTFFGIFIYRNFRRVIRKW